MFVIRAIQSLNLCRLLAHSHSSSIVMYHFVKQLSPPFWAESVLMHLLCQNVNFVIENIKSP